MKKCTYVMGSFSVKYARLTQNGINFLSDIGRSFLLYLKRWNAKPPELSLIVSQAPDNYHKITWWTASFLNMASTMQVSRRTFVFNIV